ncbi:MAG: tyrosine-type recombinase/integrase [Oscillospiraceae bacterium]|nr:tyrosine-type recombinase/integrase [Oscillospiraceae bacterium]
MKPRPLYDKKTGALTGYQLRVYAGDKPNGKKIILARNWRFDPKLPASKIERELMRQQLLFEDEVEANSDAIELQNDTEAERSVVNIALTHEPGYAFKEFTEFWLSAQYNLKQKTLDTYESKLKRVEGYFGGRNLDDIESIDIVSFLKSLREDGANLRNGKPLSMKSVREYYVLLKNIFDSACGWKKLSDNPMNAVSIPKSKYKKVKALTEDEAVVFYNALIEHAPAKYRAYLLLCMQTGTRRAEAGGLCWDKVMFDEMKIRIDTTVQYSHNKGIYEETPKTESSVRTLKITPEISKALRELKKEDDSAREKIGADWNPKGYVFTTYGGGPMHPCTPYTWLQRFQKQYGLARCSIHQLRHTNATLLMANGIDAKSLMGHLGHTNISTTDKYLDFISEKEEQAADTMASLFEPKL